MKCSNTPYEVTIFNSLICSVKTGRVLWYLLISFAITVALIMLISVFYETAHCWNCHKYAGFLKHTAMIVSVVLNLLILFSMFSFINKINTSRVFIVLIYLSIIIFFMNNFIYRMDFSFLMDAIVIFIWFYIFLFITFFSEKKKIKEKLND
jgi:hypothetical protein